MKYTKRPTKQIIKPMNLGFTQTFTQPGLKGIKTHFPAKVLKSIRKDHIDKYDDWTKENKLADILGKIGTTKLEFDHCVPKIHTIREDPTGRWKPGMKIHFIVGNRTPRRFQFAPIVECVSIQKIKIHVDQFNEHTRIVDIFIDGNWMYQAIRREGEKGHVHIEDHKMFYRNRVDVPFYRFCLNDGFSDRAGFLNYFNQSFRGVIIHWTDLKY